MRTYITAEACKCGFKMEINNEYTLVNGYYITLKNLSLSIFYVQKKCLSYVTKFTAVTTTLCGQHLILVHSIQKDVRSIDP